ncbi:hypothetical protein Ciccas_014632, partial [Cichlidogyrus casuarinus]
PDPERNSVHFVRPISFEEEVNSRRGLGGQKCVWSDVVIDDLGDLIYARKPTLKERIGWGPRCVVIARNRAQWKGIVRDSCLH